jgi:excinuclease ABC subunit C
MDIREKIKKLPEQPGVYLFRSLSGEVLYVGKASSLKKRVSSYFQKGRAHTARIQNLIAAIRDIDYIPTRSSAEALIYESALIKEKRPRYNIDLKDDKSYPYLELTTGDKFPRLFITRKRSNPESVYFGPYTSAKLLKEALSFMKTVFPLRTCRAIPKRACLSYSLGHCLGPCVGASEDVYNDVVADLKLFLSARRPELVNKLSKRMQAFSKNKRFEDAIRVRNMIEALSLVIDQKKSPPPLRRDLEGIKKVLQLKVLPARIEAFDISNISGKEAVGSMVSFFNARPQKDEYKRFKIKGVQGVDDYQMLREVIKRRYTRLLNERMPLPDLILIDGGKGHLNVARKELDKMGLAVPVISIAKEREIIHREHRPPLELAATSPTSRLIRGIRNEAHRFAISYHHLLRGKTMLSSALDDISGIAQKQKRALIEHFGSVEQMKKKSINQLMEVKGIGAKKAKEIHDYFNKK